MAVGQLDLKGNTIRERKADLHRKQAAQRKAFSEHAKKQRAEERPASKNNCRKPQAEGLSDDKAASLSEISQSSLRAQPASQKVSGNVNEYQGLVDDTEWGAWMHRKAQFKETNVLQQPDLTFAEWMTERDICKHHKGDSGEFQSKRFLFNIAFFCNTNRLWDVVSKQLQTAISGQPKPVQTATIFLLRMAGSPREEEKPEHYGAAAIVKQLANKANNASEYVRAMPFTGRKTYRAVLNREELAIIFEEAATGLARLETCASIQSLRSF